VSETQEQPADRVPRTLRTVLRLQMTLLAGVFLAMSLFIAAVLPYRSWDSLALGAWSRQIAHGGFVVANVGAANLNRPLFYVSQGYAWRWFGYHEWIGRSLSVVFAALFVVGVWLVARQLTRHANGGELLRMLAVSVALSSSVFATYVAAGMTDVPVAAMSTLAAAALWCRLPGRARLPLIVTAAAACGLTKPTGFIALGGIVLATPLVLRGAEERTRMLKGIAALAVGVGVALAYDVAEAHRLHQSVYGFLHAGNTDYYIAKGAAQRWERIVRGDWLGDGARLPVLFGVVYALARVAGLRTRAALGLASPVAITWAIAGPIAADGGTPYPFSGGATLGAVAFVALASCLLAAPFLAGYDTLGRSEYAALLLWLAPGLVTGIALRSDDVRFLSPAWPAAVLLASGALATVTRSLLSVRPALVLVPVTALTLLVVANLTSIDGLGSAGWRSVRDLGWAGWGDRARVENVAYGPFSYELDLARANTRPGQRIVSADSRLTYFFPGQVDVQYPSACADLAHARVVVLLTGGESADIATHIVGTSADPLAWTQCAAPRLTLIGEQPGIYAVFVTGTPTRPSTLDDCHIATTPGTLVDAVFGQNLTYAEARDIRSRAAAVGFGARIEQIACARFRVVVTGIPEPAPAQADFRGEATRSGFHITFRPALRYPEVAPDVKPMR
jgi:4-amino-4-deoxy-L-arabinose transferase-like glycosyltransferase